MLLLNVVVFRRLVREPQVVLKVRVLSKAFGTNGTGEGLLPRVDQLMAVQLRRGGEFFVAVDALVTAVVYGAGRDDGDGRAFAELRRSSVGSQEHFRRAGAAVVVVVVGVALHHHLYENTQDDQLIPRTARERIKEGTNYF